MLVVIYGKLAEDMNMKKYHKQLKKLSRHKPLKTFKKEAAQNTIRQAPLSHSMQNPRFQVTANQKQRLHSLS